jgi:4-hydroxy-tetrahydrodipicolinate reductase
VIVDPASLSIGIHGATGRMGTRLIQLIAEDPTLVLAAALERAGHPMLGDDAGPLAGVAPLGVALSSSLPPDAAVDAVIDFSIPHASLGIAEACAKRRIPLVVGTTGFDKNERRLLESAGSEIALLIAPNMSKAVNLLMRLAGEAARSLGASADVAIVERHHWTKKDAPSGTALRLAEFVAQGLASSQQTPVATSAAGKIDVHALRLADSPGEHTVVFAMLGETLELTHRASNRDGFARGALGAARFLAGKPAGLYTMEDVLGC